MKHLIFAVLVVGLLTMAPAVVGQGSSDMVQITFPVPVSEIGGQVDILGSAAVPGMAYYYLEYIPLNADLSIPENAPWIPMTIAITEPVVAGTLVTVDTTTVEDGLYALRLTVNTLEGQSFSDVVTPIRVSNERFFALIERLYALISQQIGQEVAPPQPEQPGYMCALPEGTPHVVTNEAQASVNIRLCDRVDNTACPVLDMLNWRSCGQIIGVSGSGSGWFQVELDGGTVGWVSPTVVRPVGDLSGVPAVMPPAPIAPPPPPPTPVPPPMQANVMINGMSPSAAPTCGVAFNINVNVANTGNDVSQPGTVTLQDVAVRTGNVTFTGSGTFPPLNPGASFVVVIPVLTTTYVNETHQLNARTGESQFSMQYVLQAGDCLGTPTP